MANFSIGRNRKNTLKATRISNVQLVQISVFVVMGVGVFVNFWVAIRVSDRQPSVSTRAESTQSVMSMTFAVSGYDESSLIRDRSFGVSVWNDSTTLPTWMKEYFDWHRTQRQLHMNETNYGQFTFLVVRCLKHDLKCGGTADRLKPLPFYVLLASRMHRILLFHWERPFLLQEFLVPPVGGVDWRLPTSWRRDQFSDTIEIKNLKDITPYLAKPHSGRYRKPLPAIACILYQSHDHGALQYNQLALQQTKEATYEEVFRDCWNSFFVPSPPVQSRIDQSRQSLGLVPNEYVGAHVRSQYHSYNGNKKLKVLVQNAVACASRLRTEVRQSIYLTADSERALQVVRESSVGMRNLPVVRRKGDRPPLHLDRGVAYLAKSATNWTYHDDPRAYYDIFVDLYLLAGSRCIAYNVGNYGKWAILLSSNRSCTINHGKTTCRWKILS